MVILNRFACKEQSLFSDQIESSHKWDFFLLRKKTYFSSCVRNMFWVTIYYMYHDFCCDFKGSFIHYEIIAGIFYSVCPLLSKNSNFFYGRRKKNEQNSWTYSIIIYDIYLSSNVAAKPRFEMYFKFYTHYILNVTIFMVKQL